MATYPLITANDDQFPAVWHTGPVDADGNTQPLDGNVDPFADSVILLLHMEGDFSDSSPYNATPAVTGATINATSKFGTGAGTAGGSTGRSVRYEGAHLDLSTGDFTIELWRKRIAANGNIFISGQRSTNDYAWFIADAVAFANPYAIRWAAWSGAGTVGVVDQNTSITTEYSNGDPYYHVAVTRSGNVFRLFLDGIKQGETTYSGPIYQDPVMPGVTLFYQDIGVPTVSQDDLQDEVRITKVCRYTDDFMVPDKAFPNPPN